MNILTNGTTAKFYCTLTDMVTLSNPNYLFVFRNRATNQIIAFVKTPAQDLSAFKSRVNRFDIDVDSVFTGAAHGIWDYDIYEQASAVNVDPTGLNALETGYFTYQPASEYKDNQYYNGTASATTTVYNG